MIILSGEEEAFKVEQRKAIFTLHYEHRLHCYKCACKPTSSDCGFMDFILFLLRGNKSGK